MFFRNSRIGMRDMLDGSSKTLFVGERGIVITPSQSYGWWVWGPETLLAAGNGLRAGFGRGKAHDLDDFDRYHENRGLRWPVV